MWNVRFRGVFYTISPSTQHVVKLRYHSGRYRIYATRIRYDWVFYPLFAKVPGPDISEDLSKTTGKRDNYNYLLNINISINSIITNNNGNNNNPIRSTSRLE